MTTPEKQEKLRRFLAEREAVPIPRNYGKLVKLLAMEIAQGIHLNLWRPEIIFVRQGDPPRSDQAILRQFIEERWQDSIDSTFTLILWAHGYIAQTDITTVYQVTEKAMDLLENPDPNNVFVSYKHSESSACALLVVESLRKYGQNAFCDMSLVPGEDWHPALEKQIEACEHFIVVVGKEIRKSSATLKEVEWAIENGKTVIPLWHNGFEFKEDEWREINLRVSKAIHRKHAVIVQNESAAGYNAAIVELLTNRFGITP
ncbi:MAG: toll/interleukin-1 receptor domain-containing protein [Chloroflexota bacterium]|nr:toll/interleukin-1 receptor domain-containing protein [Chloroflexota bacterium]